MKKILKASAGTGKTYRLSLEYLASLLKGVSFENIVVMTFTRKATAEIRDRVIKHIEDILCHGQKSKVYKSLSKIYPDIQPDFRGLQSTYNQMLLNKDSIHIYTIDSFTNKIFKQAVAPYLGIYKYEIVEDEKNEEILEKVFKELLSNPEDFALLESFFAENTERDIQNYLNLIGKMLENRWKFLLIDHKPRKPKEIEEPFIALDKCLNVLESIAVKKGKKIDGDFFVKDFKMIIDRYLKLDNLEAKRDFIKKNYSLFFKKTFWNSNKVKGKDVAQLREELQERYEEFLWHLAGYIYNEEMIPYEEQIFNFSDRVFEIYDNIKFKEKRFTHTDISNYTYRYLYQPELDLLQGAKLSDYFFELIGTEVRSFFIDEFQDTSILQWKILKPLIDECENVIAVGDEKQSIYGWRGGEKELFSRLEKIMGGESETLGICYRSEKEIMDFINRFFLNLGIAWDYEKVNHMPEKDDGYVEVLMGGKETKVKTDTKTFDKLSKEKQQEIIELNARIKDNIKAEIARRIKQLPVYKDVAVLARNNKELSSIASELDKEGIPYILESKDCLVEHDAVKPLYILLNYLFYRDYFDLIKFLRSDLVGINNRTLKYFLRNKALVEDFMNGRNVSLENNDIEKLLTGVKRLFELDYRELTGYLIEDSGIIDLFKENAGALKNIYQFFKLMRTFSCLQDLMTYIEDNINSEELRQAGIQEDNAVRLLTIHKSKGLSFETEFFYWCPTGKKGGTSPVMEIYISFDENFEEVKDYLLSNSRYEKLFEHLGFNFAEEINEKKLMEELNNVYVALTRPEKNLFIYIEGPVRFQTGNDGYCWENKSYKFYEEALLEAARVDSLCELVEAKKLGKYLPAIEKGAEREITLPDLKSYFQSEEIGEEKLKEINVKKDFHFNLEKEISRIEGLAIHYYLQHVRYNTREERKYAHRMLLARYGNILGPARVRKIEERIEKFINDNEEFFSSRWQVFNEYEIRDGEEVYRIDRLLVSMEEKKIFILDYKSGLSREQAQLDKYKEIVERETCGEYNVETRFLSVP